MPMATPSLTTALALAIAAHGAPQPAAIEPALPVILSVQKDPWNRLTLPVSIGEHGPFRFLIDTAAERTVVSDVVASRLGLNPRERGVVLGVAGKKEVGTVDVDDIRYGNVSYDGGGAPVLEAGDLGADGIVGLDGLADHRVLFDFVHNRVALIDPRSAEARDNFDIVVTARRRGGQLILTNADVDGVRADVVIDTGAETSIGNRALQRALARRQRSEGTILHSVTGQEIPADFAVIQELSIERITISNPLLAYADAPTFAALRLKKRPALLLGMKDLRLFRRFAIDFSKRKILFDLPS